MIPPGRNAKYTNLFVFCRAGQCGGDVFDYRVVVWCLCGLGDRGVGRRAMSLKRFGLREIAGCGEIDFLTAAGLDGCGCG